MNLVELLKRIHERNLGCMWKSWIRWELDGDAVDLCHALICFQGPSKYHQYGIMKNSIVYFFFTFFTGKCVILVVIP